MSAAAARSNRRVVWVATLLAIVLPLLFGWLRVRGEQAGLYQLSIGTAMLVAVLITVFVGVIWWMARSFERTDLERQRTMAFDHAVMTNMNEGLYTVDGHGLVTFMNPAAERLFGWTLDELRGRKMHGATHHTHRDGTAFPAAECAGLKVLHEGSSLTDYEDVFVRKDGTFFDVVYSSSPLREDGSIVGLVVVFRDVTERKRADEALRESEQRFRQMANVADAANRLKDQFLATLSHELRTPLQSILGYAKLLRTGAIPEAKRANALAVIERNAELQRDLVEELLDISRITSGQARLDMQSVAVIVPLGLAIDGIRPSADAKHVALNIDVRPVPNVVSGDPRRLQQIFWNLLSNAVKFTPEGGQVFVSLDSDDHTILVTIRDSGIGIPPAFLPYVFEPFRQADAGFSREHGGLGLGLAISKHLVDLHAGILRAASDENGRGSTFTVQLPLQLPADRRSLVSGEKETGARGSV
jgi:PAS domain S-box-containing protein